MCIVTFAYQILGPTGNWIILYYLPRLLYLTWDRIVEGHGWVWYKYMYMYGNMLSLLVIGILIFYYIPDYLG